MIRWECPWRPCTLHACSSLGVFIGKRMPLICAVDGDFRISEARFFVFFLWGILSSNLHRRYRWSLVDELHVLPQWRAGKAWGAWARCNGMNTSTNAVPLA